MAAGDRDAATAFVRRYQQRVFGVAFAVLGDRARADEVAQEAFLRAWRHGSTFDARRGSVASWLLVIARNVAIDALRVQRLRPTEHLGAMELRIESPDPDPERAADAAGVRARVVAALRLLPAEQRRAVVLASLAGRTAREVAELDGIPLGTAKTRIRTGLRRLRVVLDDERVDR